jgi:hypothetical protein
MDAPFNESCLVAMSVWGFFISFAMFLSYAFNLLFACFSGITSPP